MISCHSQAFGLFVQSLPLVRTQSPAIDLLALQVSCLAAHLNSVS